MIPSLYNGLSITLLLGSLIALLVSVCYLVVSLVGWRGPYRNWRFLKSVVFACLFPILVAAQRGLQYYVFMPSTGRVAQRDSQDRIATASLTKLGTSAPPFRITATDGKEVRLEDLKGRVVLLNFFATWCGPCLEELPHVQDLWEAYGDRKDFSLLVVGREETDESVAAFKKKHGYTFPMAADPEASTYLLYAEKFIPRTYLISPDGTICFATTGFEKEDFDKLKRELAKQLNEE